MVSLTLRKKIRKNNDNDEGDDSCFIALSQV